MPALPGTAQSATPSLPVASVPPHFLPSSPALQQSSIVPMALSSYGQFYQTIKSLAKPASSGMSPQASLSIQSVEVAKQVLLTKASTLVAKAQGLPISGTPFPLPMASLLLHFLPAT